LAVAAEPGDGNEPGQTLQQESAAGEVAPAVTDETPIVEGANDINAPDLNSPEEKLKKAWAEVNEATDSEARDWMDLETEKTLGLARASLRTTEAQLNLIKLVAQSEGATQTVAAIDEVLRIRSAKLDAVAERAKDARREERLREREERRKAIEERRKSRREQMNQQ
jgi:hypothetical protein